MTWRKVSQVKPEAGKAVLVWEREERNQYIAWWDGKRWWCWDTEEGDRRLPFRPTWWRNPPPDPGKTR